MASFVADDWFISRTKADLIKDNNVNFKDFAVLADNWLKEILWP